MYKIFFWPAWAEINAYCPDGLQVLFNSVGTQKNSFFIEEVATMKKVGQSNLPENSLGEDLISIRYLVFYSWPGKKRVLLEKGKNKSRQTENRPPLKFSPQSAHPKHQSPIHRENPSKFLQSKQYAGYWQLVAKEMNYSNFYSNFVFWHMSCYLLVKEMNIYYKLCK